MSQIKIIQQSNTENGWGFEVSVDGMRYFVTVNKDFWQAKTKGKETPESLVRRSFQFLLQREPKESILKEFNLLDILKYFPEYDKEIEL